MRGIMMFACWILALFIGVKKLENLQHKNLSAAAEFPTDPPHWQLPRDLEPLTADNCVTLLTAGLNSDLGVPGIIRDCRQSVGVERLALVQEWLRQRKAADSTVICLAPITVSADLPPPPAENLFPWWSRLAAGLLITIAFFSVWSSVGRRKTVPPL